MIRKCWFAELGMACALAATRAGHAADRTVSVSVESIGPRACSVVGSFTVDAPSIVIWRTLTDYDGIAGFVSSLKSSKTLSRLPGRVWLEQEAVAKSFWLSKKIRLVLEVREHPGREIAFEEVSHKDFSYYRGSWWIEPAKGGIRVTYTLEAKRNFAAPRFVADRALAANARDLLEQVRREILRRAREDGK